MTKLYYHLTKVISHLAHVSPIVGALRGSGVSLSITLFLFHNITCMWHLWLQRDLYSRQSLKNLWTRQKICSVAGISVRVKESKGQNCPLCTPVLGRSPHCCKVGAFCVASLISEWRWGADHDSPCISTSGGRQKLKLRLSLRQRAWRTLCTCVSVWCQRWTYQLQVYFRDVLVLIPVSVQLVAEGDWIFTESALVQILLYGCTSSNTSIGISSGTLFKYLYLKLEKPILHKVFFTTTGLLMKFSVALCRSTM